MNEQSSGWMNDVATCMHQKKLKKKNAQPILAGLARDFFFFLGLSHFVGGSDLSVCIWPLREFSPSFIPFPSLTHTLSTTSLLLCRVLH